MSFRVVLFCFMSLLFYGCQGLSDSQNSVRMWMHDDGRIKVLCTTAQTAALVEAVGGDAVSVLTLVPPQSDPHAYQLVKGDAEKFQRAEIVFYSGLGLELSSGLMRRIARSRHCGIGDAIGAKTQEAIVVGTVQDPHMWMDASLWAEGAKIVAAELGALRPEYTQEFEERGRAVASRLQAFHKEIRMKLQTIPEHKRYLVTSHDAFYYFCRAYLSTDEERICGTWIFRCVAPEGLAPESQISTRDIHEAVQFISEKKIAIVFGEYGMNLDSLKKIALVANQRGFPVNICHYSLYSDTMTGHGIDGYEQMLRYNADVIFAALEAA
jgi:manganese/zinc/iron transport system substrate-binding protein